jgi:phosphomannomutase
MLRGDETGALLGSYVLSTTDSTDPLVATTIVSSELLGAIARSRGVRYAETLTGFKWLVRAGSGLVFAYEEALGVCVDPDAVRDKDGIAAAVAAADLVATAKAGGRSVPELLDLLAVQHGVHVTEQIALRMADLRRIGSTMARLRSSPPTELAGMPVTAEDLLPEADVLRLRGPGLRVVVRPSGTEPKLKAYLEIVELVAVEVDPAEEGAPDRAAESLAESKERAGKRLAALRDEVTALLTE